MLWHPDPPQGFTREQGQIIIGRPIIPVIGAPQGVGEVIPTGPDMLYENDGGIMLYESDGGDMEYEV